ncbi:hypothetical protein PoB_001458200 [Plakobranchus ocellatus]|uniref:Uncharacterized protein n=1 Tax=Plakobranchus ocellatus TaxID=259542 RepID=A0AAV3Z0M5_9GAST|nr:hypothetical protein PoB_001458200 [Plakobranchus ocellatus]
MSSWREMYGDRWYMRQCGQPTFWGATLDNNNNNNACEVTASSQPTRFEFSQESECEFNNNKRNIVSSTPKHCQGSIHENRCECFNDTSPLDFSTPDQVLSDNVDCNQQVHVNEEDESVISDDQDSDYAPGSDDDRSSNNSLPDGQGMFTLELKTKTTHPGRSTT